MSTQLEAAYELVVRQNHELRVQHDDDARMVAAARAYLSARVDLIGAVAGTMHDATAALDERFHALVVACGFSCADLDCWHCEREDDQS